ncbi:MAG: MarC family protein [Bradymonadia bacterium]
MMLNFEHVWVAGLAIFVSMNVLTTAPIYVGLTDGVEKQKRPSLVRAAVILAGIVALLMTVVGTDLLRLLGVTIADLKVAGGLVLLGLGFHDLVLSRGQRMAQAAEDVGPVPIGVPLVVGPATMTTLIVMSETYDTATVVVAFLPNLLLAFVVLSGAHHIVSVVGQAGTKAIGKLMSLMLMAIGVAMVRTALKALVS